MSFADSYAALARRHKGDRTPRKEWLKTDLGTAQIMTEEQKLAQQKPFNPAYEEHLSQLSSRNKLIRDLQSKDESQIELERKEQGFSIYVNGANAELRRQKVVTKHTPRPFVEIKPKTAEVRQLGELDEFRNLSAPERGRRRQWNQKGVTLKTVDGEVYAKALDEYSEDFDVMSGDSLDEEDNDIEQVYGCMRQLTMDPDKSRIFLSVGDVKELRRSLVKSIDTGASFRFKDMRATCDDFSPISSLDEDEVEDEVDMSLDVEVTDKKATPWKEGDMLVLEFAPKAPKQRDCSTARKVKRSWEDEFSPDSQSQLAASSPTNQSENVDVDTATPVSSQSEVDTSSNPISQSEPAPVDQVVQQVLQMEPDQQQKFIEMIQRIDPGSHDLEIANSSEPKVSMNRTFTPEPCHELSILLLSNWGHENRIGLTEIQLFDKDNVKLPLKSEALKLASGSDSNLANVVNGKYKTTKDRHMWSTAFSNQAIELIVDLSQICEQPDEVKKVKIWNYNKNLQDLTIGAKDLKIRLGCRILFEGQIDKGCANQVFDYSSTFVLNYTDEIQSPTSKPEIREPSVEVDYADSGVGSDVSKSISVTSTKSDLPQEEVDVKKSILSKRKLDDRVSRSSEISRSNLIKKEETSPNRKSISAPSTDFKKSVTRSETPKTGKRPSSGRRMAANLSIPEPEEATNLAEDSMLQQLRNVKKEPSRKEKNDLRLSDDGEPLPDWPSRGLEELPCELTDMRPRRVHSGRRAGKDSSTPSSTPRSEVSESDDVLMPFPARDSMNLRAHFRQNCERSLEESWSSLNLFDKSQRGRLSTAREDDVLDDYFHSDKKMKTESNSATPVPENPNPTSSTTLSSVPETEMDCEFTIPELPRGKELLVDIRSTWGDRHYVGLTGIEIFTDRGPGPKIVKISAQPEDINVLPEYSSDPRVVSNLLDGVNQTRDDTHMWLAPYTKGQSHTLTLKFDQEYTVAVLRFWNYNKSRIHSYRGARDILVYFDKKLIFDGEIARATGGLLGGIENFGETILFTTDEDILEKVSAYDEIFDVEAESSDDDEAEYERPKTADQDEQRPKTHASKTTKKVFNEPVSSMDMQIAEIMESRDFSVPKDTKVESKMDSYDSGVEDEIQVYHGKVLKLNFTQTWGDQHYLGLTGLSLVGSDGDVPLSRDMVKAVPADLTSLPGCGDDLRTLDKLLDGTNITMQDSHMWLVPFTSGQDHVITITLPESRDVIGVRVWNYNKNPEDTYRGAKILHATLDGKSVSPPNGHLIRKGPGNCFFDFAQEILFSGKDIANEIARSKNLMLPCGFIYQFHLINTWGDQYYVGLNGLEVYDQNGRLMQLTENNVSAYPDSVNVLENVSNDARTPDKLINGINSIPDSANTWLAPILPTLVNRVFIIFDKPTTVSMIKLWNYSKTPSRGVRDFGLYVDDLLAYNGTLDQFANVARGILPGLQFEQPYHTILFSTDDHVVRQERHTAIKSKVVDQDVQMTNDRNIVTHYAGTDRAAQQQQVDQTLRPVTAVPSPVRRKQLMS